MATDERLAALEERLARAEEELSATRQEVRHLRDAARRSAWRGRVAGLVGAVALAGAFFVAGQRPGVTQAMIAASRRSAPFTVFGRRNRPIFRISEGPAGGVLQLFDVQRDSQGRPVRFLEVGDSGSRRGLFLQDRAGITFAEMTVSTNQGSAVRQIAVRNENGASAVEIARTNVGAQAFNGLQVLDDNGKSRLQVATGVPTGNNGLAVLDGDGHLLAGLGNFPAMDRLGLLLFGTDDQGNGLQAVIQSGTPAGGGIELFDPAGTSTFTAP
jgi:hypothetical protein